ncbi:SapB/AmfS family lanthipeptide [Streptomyces sp. NPDC088124]
MTLLDLQTMELPSETADEAALDSGQSRDCSDASWVFC